MVGERLGVVRVELPEHGFVDLPLAGIGTRGAAALVDFGITLVVMVLTLFGLAVGLGSSRAASVPVLSSVALSLPVLVPLLLELAWGGRSPGKQWMGLRVVGRNGQPPAASQIALRNLLRLIDFLPAGYALGLMLTSATSSAQRLGDLVAGTLLINESTDVWLANAPPVAATGELAAVPPVLLRALNALAERRETLTPDVFFQRRQSLLERFRLLRPDWAALDDEALWRELT